MKRNTLTTLDMRSELRKMSEKKSQAFKEMQNRDKSNLKRKRNEEEATNNEKKEDNLKKKTRKKDDIDQDCNYSEKKPCKSSTIETQNKFKLRKDAPVAAEKKINLKTYNGGKILKLKSKFECEEDRNGVSSELKPGLAGPANGKEGSSGQKKKRTWNFEHQGELGKATPIGCEVEFEKDGANKGLC